MRTCSPFDLPARLARALLFSLFAMGSAALTTGAEATTVSTAEAEADPPGRVGRIADLQGQVWVYHPADGDWIDAERNRPLTTGDRLATEAGGRADVRIGSTTLRLDAGTELEVLRLDDDRIDLQLHSGSLAARLRSRETVPEFAVHTGEGRFTVQRTGRYRFDRQDEASHVTVYSGQALYEGQGSALTVNTGQRAEFWIDAANVAQYSLVDPVRDAFAGWNAERDRADDRSAATQYVSPEMTGVEELDRYGAWQQHDEYGALWVPRVVAPGWAPYSTGRWTWVAPWGWTWIDEAPWGFAPFHYGRWVYVGSRWCWSPGHFVRRPVYAPALVAWIGGPRLSIGISSGPAIGWLPLAPREVYVPGYRVTPGYLRSINITHVVNLTNVTTIVNNPRQAVIDRDYQNRKFPHAVTVVPASTLSARAAVGPAARPWRDAPALREMTRQPVREAALLAAPPAAVTTSTRTLSPGTPGARPGLPSDIRRERVVRDEREGGDPRFGRDARGGRDLREGRREDGRGGREGRDGRDGGRDGRDGDFSRRPVPARPGVAPEAPRTAVRVSPLPQPAPAPAPSLLEQQREERKRVAPPVARERRQPGPPPQPTPKQPTPQQPRERHEPSTGAGAAAPTLPPARLQPPQRVQTPQAPAPRPQPAQPPGPSAERSPGRAPEPTSRLDPRRVAMQPMRRDGEANAAHRPPGREGREARGTPGRQRAE
ncbi:MAG: FecR domain-containing protein [Piscinibacter sp.]|nr:FecR domain-containing protein [Piscinibacter sp.]